MTTNRQLWKEHISAEYKQIPPFIVDWLLDIYETNPEWFAQQIKQEKRKKKAKNRGTSLPHEEAGEGVKPEFYELNNVKILGTDKESIHNIY